MVVYPNAKINIGLFVTEKRKDGFHKLESVFYPIGLSDRIEIKEMAGKNGEFLFRNAGIEVDCPEADNLIIKAYRLLVEKYQLPAIDILLDKRIPYGAGLGGGSSDAAFMLKALNEYFDLNISRDKLVEFGLNLGSDCAFFIDNNPAFVSGRGDIMESINLNLNGYSILLLKPFAHISTREAYQGISPVAASMDLRGLSKSDIFQWRGNVVNDFEKTIFPGHPEINKLKDYLYENGAVYASMTGSGAAVYGLFKAEDVCPDPAKVFELEFIWKGQL